MKKMFIVVLTLVLSGCATVDKVLDAYFMKYDSNEYRLITEIRTNAQIFKQDCDTQDKAKLYSNVLAYQSRHFVNHTEYLPRNNVVKKSADELDKIIQGLNDQYKKNDKVSATFCKLKLDTVSKNAELMQKTIGDKPR